MRPRCPSSGAADAGSCTDRLGKSLPAMVVFVRLSEERSFTSAARVLGLTTSSVSKWVSRLEQRLGVRLVERTTRSFALTEAGATLFRRYRRILRQVDEAERAVAEDAER